MNRLPSVKEIKVGLDFGENSFQVGRLAIKERSIFFEYEPEFIDQSFDISPLHLPRKAGITNFDNTLFEGLPGVFNDSLPDGWGRLLFDRYTLTQNTLPSEVTPLDRLAYIGKGGMGALVYEPMVTLERTSQAIIIDSIARQAQDVLDGSPSEDFMALLLLNGSASGARPKALIGVSKCRGQIMHGSHPLNEGFEPWLVKFPNKFEGIEFGAIEYVYALMAKEAGIEMPEIHLFPAIEGPGYFATKRFDCNGNKRFHMHTASGLMHADFHVPSLDYKDLINLTFRLTRDIRDVEKMYRLAVFNVLAHNRDDHAKNFSYLMDAEGKWKLSPAYDLTFSSGPAGEQSSLVMGEGRNPGVDHLIKLGIQAKIPKPLITEIIEQTRSTLASWPMLAKQYGVRKSKITMIAKRLSSKK